MPALELAAVVLITLALVAYSIGVWAERFTRYLRGWHVAAFWTGFAFDTSGTLAMDLMEPGFDWSSSHTVTGQIALWLMFAHAVWATRVVRSKDETAKTHFHRFSLVVWTIWLVPYIGGMILGMSS
jgi:uncharacterized repeat protein (TIGR03987 family)